MPASPPAIRTFLAGEVETAAYLNSLGAALAFTMNPPHGKMWSNTNVSAVMAASTNTIVVIGGSAVANGFTYSSNTLTVPTSGVYLLTAQVRFSNIPNGTFAKTMLFVNGASLAQSIVNNVGTGAILATQPLSLLQALNPGDTIQLYGFCSGTGCTTFGDSNATDTFLYAQWVAAA